MIRLTAIPSTVKRTITVVRTFAIDAEKLAPLHWIAIIETARITPISMEGRVMGAPPISYRTGAYSSWGKR